MNKRITKKMTKTSKTRRSNTTIETRHKIKGNKQLNNWQTSASVTSYIYTYLLRGWLLTHCFYGLLLRMRTHHDDASAHHTCHKWKKITQLLPLAMCLHVQSNIHSNSNQASDGQANAYSAADLATRLQCGSAMTSSFKPKRMAGATTCV